MRNTIFGTLLLLLGLHQVLGAENCYVCLDTCEEPIQGHSCRDGGLSDSVQIKCYTIEVTSGGKSLTEKGCLPAEQADVECAKANKIEGTKCTTCDGDLCNGPEIKEGTGAGVGVEVSFLVIMISYFGTKFLE